MTISNLEQYVDGLPLTEIKKKKLVETDFKGNSELVGIIENLRDDEYFIISENNYILPTYKENPLTEMSSNEFWKTYNECRLIDLPESQRECIDKKINPQKVIHRSLAYWKYRRNKESKNGSVNASCRGIMWRGIGSLDTLPKVLPILEDYRGLRVYCSGNVKIYDYSDRCVGEIPSFDSEKPENTFKLIYLPLNSKGDHIYEAWINLIPYDETKAALFESTSKKFKIDEHRFTFGSVATLISRFLNKDLEDRLMLYPFPILNKKFIDFHYKMANNVLVRYKSEFKKLKLKKLLKAEKENLNWWYIHNNNLPDLFLFGGDLKETTDALNKSIAYSKEKN